MKEGPLMEISVTRAARPREDRGPVRGKGRT